MLGSILHGVWNVKEGSIETHPRFGLEVGEEIKYQCHSGYKLIGSSVLKCMPQGLWSSQVPECIPDSGTYRYNFYIFFLSSFCRALSQNARITIKYNFIYIYIYLYLI